MVGKGMTTLPVQANEILVTNFIESTNGSEGTQLTGYIFACCIALAPSLPFFVRWLCSTIYRAY